MVELRSRTVNINLLQRFRDGWLVAWREWRRAATMSE
jgi:hypothetical protein